MKTPAIWNVLGIPGLRRLWFGQAVSVLGDFLAIFAIFTIAAFRMRGTALEVSLVLVAYLLPFTVVSPVAGVFVDRWDVKRTLIASDIIRAALCALLPLAGTVWQISGVMLLLGTVSTFFSAAHSVAIRAIVPREELINANAVIQQVFYGMQILGPAVAGVMVRWLGPQSCFWSDSASFLLSAWMISGIAIRRERSSPRQLSSFLSEMSAGIRFIFSKTTILIVVAATSSGMFVIRCFNALSPIYVRDLLKSGAEIYGLLSSVFGVGTIVGNLFVHRVANKRRAHAILCGVFGIALTVAFMAGFPNRPVSIAGMTLMGVCFAFLVAPAHTLVQEETPPELLGRVIGSMTSAMMASQVVGLFIAGPVGQLIGIENLYFTTAALLGLMSAIMYYWLWRTRLDARRSGAMKASPAGRLS